MKIEFHPEAEEEFIQASQFYDLKVSGLGDKFIHEVEQATALLSERTEIGQRIDRIYRRIVLDRFPFSLIYSIEPNKAWIIALAHQKRRPGYWRSRIDC